MHENQENGIRKRSHDQAFERRKNSSKKSRSYGANDARIASIFEQLSSDSKDTRMVAAEQLLDCKKDEDSDATQWSASGKIVRRLVRGLCSNRKAARLGFFAALTEVLRCADDFGKSVEQYVSLVQEQTKPPGNAAAQEKRDHHLGQMIGYSAFLNAKCQSGTATKEEVKLIVVSMDQLAHEIKWLSEELGVSICGAIKSLDKTSESDATIAISILESMQDLDVARRVEGLAVWLTVREVFPTYKLPKHVWKGTWMHRDPFSADQIPLTLKLLKGTTSVLTASPHFIFPILFRSIFQESLPKVFSRVWRGVVDGKLLCFLRGLLELTSGKEGCLAQGSSSERRAIGFQLYCLVCDDGPEWAINEALSQHFLNCLTNQSKKDRVLTNAAQRALKTTEKRAIKGEISLVMRLLQYSSNFDKISSTKIVHNILETLPTDHILQLVQRIINLIKVPQHTKTADVETTRRNLADLLSNGLARNRISAHTDNLFVVNREWLEILLFQFAELAYFSAGPLTDKEMVECSGTTKSVFHSKIYAILGHILSQYKEGSISFIVNFVQVLLGQVINEKRMLLVHIDQSLLKKVLQAISGKGPNDLHSVATQRAYHLLIVMTLIEVLSGDKEAIDVLEDLLALISRTGNGGGDQTLIEIILSLVSKPLSLHRKIAEQVMGAIGSSLTSDDLQSMLDILEQPENSAGQQALFDHAKESDDEDDDDLSGSEDEDGNDETEKIESKPADTSDDSSSEVSEDTPSSGGDSDNDHDAFEALDKALSEALRTSRPPAEAGSTKPEADVDDSSSDISMTDSQMIELEPHLAEIFRQNHPNLSSANNKSKSTKPKSAAEEHRAAQKTAKQNMINFKVRILSLLHIYVKEVPSKALALTLLLPLLRLMRTSSTKQLTEKANEVLGVLISITKNKAMPRTNIQQELLQVREIHDEALLFASKAHTAACSRASVFLCKIVLHNAKFENEGMESHYDTIATFCDMYNTTTKLWMADQSKMPHTFFRDFSAWLESLKQDQVPNTAKDSSTKKNVNGHAKTNDAENGDERPLEATNSRAYAGQQSKEKAPKKRKRK